MDLSGVILEVDLIGSRSNVQFQWTDPGVDPVG